jgi:hypothetical protein
MLTAQLCISAPPHGTLCSKMAPRSFPPGFRYEERDVRAISNRFASVTCTRMRMPQEGICCAPGHDVTLRTGSCIWGRFTGEPCLGRRRCVSYSRRSIRSWSGDSTARGAHRDRLHFGSSRLPAATCGARCAARPIACSPRAKCA